MSRAARNVKKKERRSRVIRHCDSELCGNAARGSLAARGQIGGGVAHGLDHVPWCPVWAAGVEGRCPFLEADLQEFGARRDQLGKRDLLAAFAGELPTEVVRLGKRGFGVPLDDWFRGDLPWLDVLREQRTCQRAHLRPGGIAEVLDRHRRGAADLGHGLYLLLAIELHLRDLDATEESATT